MFIMTKEWLHQYYGSTPNQEQQAKDWMLQYGKDFITPKQMEDWKIWKHLIEYSPNTPTIVQQCLDKITGLFQFETELQAHRFVNMLRVPLSASYEQALAVAMPKKLLELGIGGDSGISTSVFLAYVEKVGGTLFSVDINQLGVTLLRYDKYRGTLWNYKLDDSARFLDNKIALNERYDLIFIDTSHTYEQTMLELDRASKITNFMLMDDALFPGNTTDKIQGGVKKAIADWFATNSGWKKEEFWQGGTVLLFKEKELVKEPVEVKLEKESSFFTDKKNKKRGK